MQRAKPNALCASIGSWQCAYHRPDPPVGGSEVELRLEVQLRLSLPLVIVHDLDVHCPWTVGPSESDTPLPVDTNGILSLSVTSESFQAVAR